MFIGNAHSTSVMKFLNIGFFNVIEKHTFVYVRHFFNDFELIIDPAAAGRFYVIKNIVQSYLLSFTTGVNFKTDEYLFMKLSFYGAQGPQGRVLIFVPDNVFVDNLVLQIYEMTIQKPETKNAIIVRMHRDSDDVTVAIALQTIWWLG